MCGIRKEIFPRNLFQKFVLEEYLKKHCCCSVEKVSNVSIAGEVLKQKLLLLFVKAVNRCLWFDIICPVFLYRYSLRVKYFFILW